MDYPDTSSNAGFRLVCALIQQKTTHWYWVRDKPCILSANMFRSCSVLLSCFQWLRSSFIPIFAECDSKKCQELKDNYEKKHSKPGVTFHKMPKCPKVFTVKQMSKINHRCYMELLREMLFFCDNTCECKCTQTINVWRCHCKNHFSPKFHVAMKNRRLILAESGSHG